MNRLSIIAAFFALLFSVGHSALAQSGYDLFQKGLVAERTEGDLDEAIRLYKQIVAEHKDDHALAAKALIQMGRCYEKLGQTEAQKAYQRVIEEYPEQRGEVAIAKERIAELSKALEKVVHKLTFTKIHIPTKPQNGVLSPDGNKLAIVSGGAMWMVPLHGKVDTDIAGEPVRLAEVPGIRDFGSLIAWPADGQWIAVNGEADDEDVVYVVPAAGGEPRMVQIPDRGGHSWSHRLSLSPDGQILAFSALELGKPRAEVSDSHKCYIYTIPTIGGEAKQISSGWGRMPAFSPDGQFIAYVGYRKREPLPKNTTLSRFHGDLWVVPSAGGTPVRLATADGRLRGPVWSPDGKYIAAHHEPGGSNDSKEIWVFPLSPDASSAGEPEKIALPRSSWNMLAGWTPENELGVFMESERHVAIYTVPTQGGKAVQVSPQGGYYPRWSPDGERIYFRGSVHDEKNVSNVSVAYVPSAGGDPAQVPVRSERRLVSRLPGGGSNVSPDGKKIVFSAYQGPYDPKEGVDVWTIPLDGGSPIRLTSDASFECNPCWSPDGEWIAFVDHHETSEKEDFLAIYVVPAEGGQIRQVSSESDNVGGGAIAFSPDGERIAFFSKGSIKTIPVEGGEPEVLVGEVKSDRRSQLAYSPDGSKIAHNARGKIWITSLDGGEPQELSTGLPKEAKLGGFSWSPDGEKMAFIASIGGEAEFWLIENFLPEIEPKVKTVRQVWSGSDVDIEGAPSPDGKYISYVDWDTGDLAVYEIATGNKRRLTNKGSWDESDEFAISSRWSPDGKKIVYEWYNKQDFIDLCIVGLDGSKPRILYSNEKVWWAQTYGWSPDGKEILACFSNKHGDQIVLVSVEDGSVRVLKTLNKYQPQNMSFSPDGRYIVHDFPQKEDSPDSDISLLLTDGSREIPLIEHPADDRVLGWSLDGKHILITSDRTGTKSAWLIEIEDGDPQGDPEPVKQDIGQRFIPMGFTKDGSFYYGSGAVGVSDVYIAKLDPESGKVLIPPKKAIQRFEGHNLTPDYSPDGKYLAYTSNRGRRKFLCIRPVETGQEREFRSKFRSILEPRWSPDGSSILVGGMDYKGNRLGIYRVDIKTGTFSLVLPPPEGIRFSTYEWSPDGKSFFLGLTSGKDKVSQIMLREIESGTEKEIYRTSDLGRFRLSCSPDGKWLAFISYAKKGALRIIPTAGGEPQELYISEQENEQLVTLRWTSDGKYIFLVIRQPEHKNFSLLRIPKDGGEFQKLGLEMNIMSLSVHPDGQHIAFNALTRAPAEVWVMENFLPESAIDD